MTDIIASQAALIALSKDSGQGAVVSQAVAIVVCNDIPPKAAGVKASQVVLIVVSHEYNVTNKPYPYNIRSIWGFPYYVERKLI